MRILYCHDNVYQKCKDGIIYSPGQFPYSYWKPYLANFDHLTVTGRSMDIQHDPLKMNVSGGPNVSFVLFPKMNTIRERLKFWYKTRQRLKQAVENSDGVIIRAVSDLGWISYKHARRMGKPIAMEMAACAWDSTWNHGHPYAKIYAPIRYIRDKIIARNADYVIYVSEYFLQNRYPTNGITAHASNVRVHKPDEIILQNRLNSIKEREEKSHHPTVIGLIGNLDNKIKGVSVTLEALALIEKQKPGSFIFQHLGPGDPAPYLAQAKELGLEDKIYFAGMIKSGDGVLQWLDKIDIYLQPSFQEGVPRATIEAMSRGCPIIASTAGGIPELIEKKWLIKPGDIDHLAKLILRMMDRPESQINAATLNYNNSFKYTNEFLSPRREDFWHEFGKFIQSKHQKKSPIMDNLILN